MAVCFLIRVLFERPGSPANLALFFSPLGWVALAKSLISNLLYLRVFVPLCEALSLFTSYLNPPAFPEVIGYFVSECLLVFVRQASEKTIADVVAGVLRGFVQDVAVPEDDIACFCR